jgi:putative peptidoglycan lipid II flippase
MVGRILRTLGTPVRGLHEAAYVLAGLTLAAQALALLRDRLFAHHFGASEILDLYYAAFKVPDLVFALIASLVSAYVLIPRLARADEGESKRLISETASFLLIGGGVVSVGLAVFAPQLLFFLFPSFLRSAHAAEFVMLARILLIQPILLGLSSIATSVLQVHRRIFLFALSPVLYNLGIIAGIEFLYPRYGLIGIGFGVLLGAVLHLGIQLPSLIEAGLFPRLIVPDLKRMRDIIKDSVPRSLALGMGSFVTLGLTAIAAKLSAGSVSVFNLAANLEGVPLALIGASYATAAFPALAEHAGNNDDDGFRTTLRAAARHLIFWSAVITILTIVLRAHIVRAILGSGAFDWDATRLTAAVLAILAVALIAQGMTLLASRAFYAAHRSWNPLLIQLVGAVISLAGGWLMLHASITHPVFRFFIESLFRVSDVGGTGVLMVALGAALGQVVMGILAFITLGTVAKGVAASLVRPLLEGIGAAIIGGAAAYTSLAFTGSIAPLTTLTAVFTEALVAGMVGLVAAAAVLLLLENEEFKDVYRALHGFSTRLLPPQSEF